MVCPPPLLIFRLACCGTGFNSCSVFFSSAIVSIPHSVGANQAWSPGKRKTDLKRSVSLLAPRHPSDHLQVTVQRLPESPVSTLSVWLRLLCSISRRGPSESLVCSSLGGAGGHVGGMQCEVPDVCGISGRLGGDRIWESPWRDVEGGYSVRRRCGSGGR
jgi:hypothetical protein